MNVRGISHIAIGVRDIDAALLFWRDFMGLEVTADLIEKRYGPHNESEPVGIRTVHRRGVYLRWPDDPLGGFVVLGRELDREPFGEPARLHQVGVHHIGYAVDRLDDFVQRAERLQIARMGGPSLHPGADYGDASRPTIRTALFCDPDGNFVQLDEYASSLGPAIAGSSADASGI